MSYTIEDMMIDIADNIRRDCKDGYLTKESIIDRLRSFKDNVIEAYNDGEI